MHRCVVKWEGNSKNCLSAINILPADFKSLFTNEIATTPGWKYIYISEPARRRWHLKTIRLASTLPGVEGMGITKNGCSRYRLLLPNALLAPAVVHLYVKKAHSLHCLIFNCFATSRKENKLKNEWKLNLFCSLRG